VYRPRWRPGDTLGTRGCDISSSLWSCEILLSSPELIQQVHLDYFMAGANIAITASYQASEIGLAKYRGMSAREAADLIKTSVKLAQDAREQAAAESGRAREDMLIAGSVGPYGAYLADGSEYRGDYGATMSKEDLKAFHRPRIAALLEAGADVLACETIPSVFEIEALCELLEVDFPTAWAWISVTVRDAAHLSDGTSLDEVCQTLKRNNRIVAVGANCIPLVSTNAVLEVLAPAISLPLVAYPNSGETWNAETREWYVADGRGKDEGSSGSVDKVAKCALLWYGTGARLIGGCCRTGPEDIREISSALQKLTR
jgi:homocysteine S-methyltransferase